ncbi:MAG: hypothetical protein GY822_13820 [Deltaproteobacteria bacterium]|nr:hypothetical protein [Deltaproteobacteria bacterium]
MNIAKKSVALLVLGLVGLFPTPAFATRVTVTGQAAAVDGDKGATLKAVKRAARREAVEAGAGTLVQSNTIVRNYQMVSDEIATSSSGVLTSEQFGKMKIKDGVAEISLSANVETSAIEDAICTVIKANHNPRIAFMFVERRIDGEKDSFSSMGTAQRGTIESMLASSLVSNCFTLVETGVKVTELTATGDVPTELINQAIEEADAQYLLVGTGEVTRTRIKGSKAGSYGFDASVKLINVDTRKISVVVNASQRMPGFTLGGALKGAALVGGPTLTKNDYGSEFTIKNRKHDDGTFKKYLHNNEVFSNRIMGKLFSAVAKDWSAALVNQSKVLVHLTNVKKFKHLKAFKKLTSLQFKGAVIQNPKLRRGKATMTVEGIDGGADAFAEAIEGKKVAGMTVEVTEVSGGKIVLTLTK